jgi:hypothetical protein
MYQPYPASGLRQEPQRIQPPRSVLNAVKLMYVGAALSALILIITLVTIGGLKTAILARHPDYTSAQLHDAEVAGIATAVIGGLIPIGLWLWMAWANGRGRGWARVLSAVFFGISTLELIIPPFLPADRFPPAAGGVHAAATLIIDPLLWLVGLGAIMLIFNKNSGPFYKQQAAP